MSCGVIGNTSDSESEESRFDPWQDNLKMNHLSEIQDKWFLFMTNMPDCTNPEKFSFSKTDFFPDTVKSTLQSSKIMGYYLTGVN